MGDAGTASARFDRAIKSKNGMAALSAAAELPTLPLDRALELVLVLRTEHHDRFPRAASRWIERWLTETVGVTVDEVREVAQALVHVDERHVCAALGAIFHDRGQRSLERAVARWVPETSRRPE